MQYIYNYSISNLNVNWVLLITLINDALTNNEQYICYSIYSSL